MSEGATTSAPARACETATRASSGSVASLSTSPSRMTPQWPWDVYSSRQTSVITAMSRNRVLDPPHRLLQRRAVVPGFAAGLVLPVGDPEEENGRDPGAVEGLRFAQRLRPERAGPPRAETRSARAASGRARTKSGATSCSAESRVSRTSPRSAGERRNRRMRTWGNPAIVVGAYFPAAGQASASSSARASAKRGRAATVTRSTPAAPQKSGGRLPEDHGRDRAQRRRGRRARRLQRAIARPTARWRRTPRIRIRGAPARSARSGGRATFR